MLFAGARKYIQYITHLRGAPAMFGADWSSGSAGGESGIEEILQRLLDMSLIAEFPCVSV